MSIICMNQPVHNQYLPKPSLSQGKSLQGTQVGTFKWLITCKETHVGEETNPVNSMLCEYQLR